MVYSEFESYFINSAYLSELWAVKDLIRIKKLCPNEWTNDKEQQLTDEIRHSRMLLDALLENETQVFSNLEFSMQERLYKPFISLSTTANIEQHSIVHGMTERRAAWIYKTYVKYGRNDKFVSVIKNIFKDELSHLRICDDFAVENEFSKLVYKIDSEIFKNKIVTSFGQSAFTQDHFWKKYYDSAETNLLI